MPWEKQFDRTVALCSAERQFWTRGYDGSSLEDLLRAMSIQKGSFYATFGSKHQLLLETLNSYIQKRFECLNELSRSDEPLRGLRQHLQDVFEESTGRESRMGCFLVNASLELAPHDEEVRKIVQNALKQHQGFYRDALQHALVLGELSPQTDTFQLAAGLLNAVLGLRVAARAGLPLLTIEAMHRNALRLLAPSAS